MRIAVTYDNGEVFQHFGRTESFKVYDIEDGKVIKSEVIGNDGLGHGALAGLLENNSIDLLICGGIGGGARNALADAGVNICSGASGNTDEVIEAYLRGELEDAGSTCHHHDHEEGHSCGDHGCGDHDEKQGCGGHGCGGCHSAPDPIEGKNVGKNVKVHYTGTLNDGSVFDSSYDRGKTLDFVCGAGMMIRGFDKAVANMEVGEIIDVHLEPSEAYGDVNPAAIFTIEIAQLPGSEDLEVGEQVYLTNSMGMPFAATVAAKDDKTITMDANHGLAGKELNFRIELIAVE